MYIVPLMIDYNCIFQNIVLYNSVTSVCIGQCTGCVCACRCACKVTETLLNW